MSARHRVLPFFLDGCHCPVGCVYCDQVSQTGGPHIVNGAVVRETVAQAGRDTRVGDERPLAIAFYGGTFTSLPPSQQADLLQAASDERAAGRIAHVRVSTHPRWLGAPHLDLLRSFEVDVIEVGVQCLDDTVLARARRGVRAADILAALERVRAAGFGHGVQTMVGLPGASRAVDRQTAERLATVGASLGRVYPTVVLRGAELAADFARGEYVPLTVPQAIERAADQVDALEGGGVVVQRIGLHLDGALRAAVVAGPMDEAFGDRVRGEIAWRRLRTIASATAGASLRLRVPPTEHGQWLGQRRVNIDRFEAAFPSRQVIIQADDDLLPGEVDVEGRP